MEIFKVVMVKLKVMNPEVNQEIQELKKELKELNQLVKALLTVTDEGGTVNADSLVIKMLKVKINKK
jgi:uncharacterized coiled-coil DUF342 family protein